MQSYEVESILDGFEYKQRTAWEQSRMISYVTAQCNSSKKLKPQDIIRFPWDDEKDEVVDWDGLTEMRKQIEKLNKK